MTGIQRLTQNWKNSSDNMEGIVKYVPMIFVNFIIIVIILSKKTKGGFTFIPPLEKFGMLVVLYIITYAMVQSPS